MGTSTETKLCCFSLGRQWFLHFRLEVLFFGKGGRKDPSKGVCCVDALAAAGRVCLPALLRCLLWAGAGNSLQLFARFVLPTRQIICNH